MIDPKNICNGLEKVSQKLILLFLSYLARFLSYPLECFRICRGFQGKNRFFSPVFILLSFPKKTQRLKIGMLVLNVKELSCVYLNSPTLSPFLDTDISWIFSVFRLYMAVESLQNELEHWKYVYRLSFFQGRVVGGCCSTPLFSISLPKIMHFSN